MGEKIAPTISEHYLLTYMDRRFENFRHRDRSSIFCLVSSWLVRYLVRNRVTINTSMF